MADQGHTAVWDGKDVLEPFSWPQALVVLVTRDLFEPEVRGKFRDEVFASMALCPQHQFKLRTAHPREYRRYVDEIARDRGEYLAWRASAALILRRLDREGEATGPGPIWPLPNVALIV